MVKKKLQIVTKLDDSKFRPMPRGWKSNKEKSQEAITRLASNIWSMFDLKQHKKNVDVILRAIEKGKNGPTLRLNDFGWTKSVKKDFFNHRYHKKFIEYIKSWDSMVWFMFEMNNIPDTVNKKGETKI